MEDLEFKTILGYIMRLCLPKQTKSHIKEHRQIEELEFRVFLYILLSEGFNFVHRVPESAMEEEGLTSLPVHDGAVNLFY